MEYTKEQLKAAYALNLCTVSVSQIVDYDDANIMEQEYEAILNNLNLEQMPKDDALLNVLKQILDTITFFRIQEGDKKMIDKKYQQKMKNAIWSAVPNIGLLVGGGSIWTMAISLASQIGIGYMNYRRTKAENALQQEEEMWQLERAAIEQFNGLRRELFDTAWRLATAYDFPDQLRLTERQISLYNSILMDDKPVRKYERLNSIKQYFLAYPPFWYHFGNTANRIAGTVDGLDEDIRNEYKRLALEHFKQYRESNQYGLLRDDIVSSSCALEMADLLDQEKDRDLICELLDEAVRFSGRANDVLQLVAIGYMKIKRFDLAKDVLRILVNEQYNTEMNAQFLSSIFVSEYISLGSVDSRRGYAMLNMDIDERILFPMPEQLPCSMDELQDKFILTQKENLKQKYINTINEFEAVCSIYYDQIVLPIPDEEENYSVTDWYQRVAKVSNILSSHRTADAYIDFLNEYSLQEQLLTLMNDMYYSVCSLSLVGEELRTKLVSDIEKGLSNNRGYVSRYQNMLNDGHLNILEGDNLLGLKYDRITKTFFDDLRNEVNDFVETRKELQDISIAEQNLSEFCIKEQLSPPEITYNALIPVSDTDAEEDLFTVALFGTQTIDAIASNEHMGRMMKIIEAYKDELVLTDDGSVEFYTEKDARVERYFESNSRIATNRLLKSKTLAVLDDKSRKGDIDLIFTTYGIVPVKGGIPKDYVRYHEVTYVKQGLNIGGLFSNEAANKALIREMCEKLEVDALPLSRTTKVKKSSWNPFRK